LLSLFVVALVAFATWAMVLAVKVVSLGDEPAVAASASDVAVLVIGSVALALAFAALLLLYLRAGFRLERSRGRLGLLLRGARAGLWEWDLLGGTATFSARWHAILGLKVGEVARNAGGWLERVHPEDADRVQQAIQSHLAGETAFFDEEHRLRHGSGRYQWVRVRGMASLETNGQATAMAGSMWDVGATREARVAAAEQDLVDRALTGLGGAVVILNLDHGMFQHSAGLPSMVTQWPSIDAWWAQLRNAIRFPAPRVCPICDAAAVHGEAEVSVRGPHGKRQVFQLIFGGHDHLSAGPIPGNILLVRDVTEDTRVAELAALDAITDENNVIDRVTGLEDRRAFLKKLDAVMTLSEERKVYDYVVVCLDLDGLGLVNDTLGSQAGDVLLKTVADRLKRGLTDGDTVSRIGGDEFGVMLRGIGDTQRAITLISRLPASIGGPVDLMGLEVIPTATVGALLGHAEYESAEDVLSQAEAACRSAVKGGKRAVEIVRGPVAHGARKTLRMNNDLRRALDREEFQLHFQPIVPLQRGQSGGFEALLRWQHPEFGPVSPSDFIPLAEATGAIVPIGLWVLRQACLSLAAWRGSRPDLVMSVNLSMRQLREEDVVEQMGAILAEVAVEPSAVKLEITESAVMENPAEAERLLGQLKNLGFQLWVDDFGTGYSSLSYLQRFPIDGLKIDRSFVSPLMITEGSDQIATSIIELGHNLGLSVVAEGIETPEQLAFLESRGCDLGQGNYFSRPMSQADATHYLSKWSARYGDLPLASDTIQDAPAIRRS